MDILAEIAVLVALTVVNGLFAGSEIAMLSLRKTRLRELMDEKAPGAKAALLLREDPERLLATIQVGITVIGATTAVFGGARLAEPLSNVFVMAGLRGYAQEAAFVTVVALVSYLSLVLGELVPKSIALQKQESFALRASRPLLVLSVVTKPLVWLLTKSSNVVLRPLSDSTTFTESRFSPDEIQQLVEEAAASHTLNPVAGEMASRAIDLGALRIDAVMISRQRIVWMPVNMPAEDTLALLRSDPHARYPVYEDSEENVVGYVMAREIYQHYLADPEKFELRSILHKAKFIPEQTLAVDALRQLQAAKQHVALIVDEQGAITGLVSVEDIAEELMGEIFDEDEDATSPIEKEADGALQVQGDTPVHEVGRELGLELEPQPGSTTIAGLLIAAAGRIPVAGEVIHIPPNLEAEVMEASARQVTRLRVRVLPESAETDTSETA